MNQPFAFLYIKYVNPELYLGINQYFPGRVILLSLSCTPMEFNNDLCSDFFPTIHC